MPLNVTQGCKGGSKGSTRHPLSPLVLAEPSGGRRENVRYTSLSYRVLEEKMRWVVTDVCCTLWWALHSFVASDCPLEAVDCSTADILSLALRTTTGIVASNLTTQVQTWCVSCSSHYRSSRQLHNLLCRPDVWVFYRLTVINTGKGRVYDGIQGAQSRQQVRRSCYVSATTPQFCYENPFICAQQLFMALTSYCRSYETCISFCEHRGKNKKEVSCVSG